MYLNSPDIINPVLYLNSRDKIRLENFKNVYLTDQLHAVFFGPAGSWDITTGFTLKSLSFIFNLLIKSNEIEYHDLLLLMHYISFYW